MKNKRNPKKSIKNQRKPTENQGKSMKIDELQ